VQSFTSTQAATCRELQLSLVFQSLLEGSYNPLAYRSKNNFHQLAAVPDISYTQNITLRQYADLEIRIINHIKIVHFKPLDPDLSLDLVLHQPVRSLLSSDQAMHHQPITCILDLMLHQIFKTFQIHLPNDFFSLYSLRPCSIPRAKTIVTQYHQLQN
jgi:hypothetical protein